MNDGVMCDYFDYNGTRYYTGSKFKCNNFIKIDVVLFPEIEITFIKYNKKSDTCFVHSNIAACDFMFSLDSFTTNIIGVIAPKTKEDVADSNKAYKDNKRYYHWVEDGEDCYRLKTEEIVIGWICYVTLMAIISIFKERILLWLILTISFFMWRTKTLKGK